MTFLHTYAHARTLIHVNVLKHSSDEWNALETQRTSCGKEQNKTKNKKVGREQADESVPTENKRIYRMCVRDCERRSSAIALGTRYSHVIKIK